MIGFTNLPGSTPCPRCGSESGDCGWLRETSRCSPRCTRCKGTNVGRCGFCAEVVPCGHEIGRNPQPDALCAWAELAALHAPDCPWTVTRGGSTEPLRSRILPVATPRT